MQKEGGFYMMSMYAQTLDLSEQIKDNLSSGTVFNLFGYLIKQNFVALDTKILSKLCRMTDEVK